MTPGVRGTARRVAPVSASASASVVAGPPSVANAAASAAASAFATAFADGFAAASPDSGAACARSASAAASISAFVTASMTPTVSGALLSGMISTSSAPASGSGGSADARLPRLVVVARIAARADSSLDPVDGVRAGSDATTASIRASAASSPLSSSTSSSTNRSTTRLRETASTSSRLTSTIVSSNWSFRLRRSWRIVTSSTSGASPHCSRISERASEWGQSRGPAVRSAGPSSSSRRCVAPPLPSPLRRPIDLTEIVVPFAFCRSRAANPARASAPSAVSR